MYTISTLLLMAQCTPTALCYVWHNVHQQHFVTYGTMYTNNTLLRMTQCTPTELCYVRYNVHQHHFVMYGTMYTSSTFLRMAQWTPTALCYIWHNEHQQHFVTYGIMYTSAQEINVDLERFCCRMEAKINSWPHVTDVLHLTALLFGLQPFLVRASWIHYAR